MLALGVQKEPNLSHKFVAVNNRLLTAIVLKGECYTVLFCRSFRQVIVQDDRPSAMSSQAWRFACFHKN